MERFNPIKLFLILTLGICACGSPTASLPTPIVASSPQGDSIPVTESIPTASPPGLTVEQIKNVQYPLLIPADGRVVQMSDGTYQSGTDTLAIDFAYIAVTQFVALGDMTSDGVGDAAVLFLENYGGTGNFSVLAIYADVSGEPVFLDSILIDDRPLINVVGLANGEFFIDAIVHSFDDGGCCPTLATTQTYALVKNKIRLVNYTTLAPNAVKREIVINTPVDNTEITTGSLQLTGTVSIAPFENNLTYYIYDEDINEYMSGTINVTAPDFGAPGTFDITLALDVLPAGVYYLEIQDHSATDGSIFASDVVKFIVK